MHVIGKTPTIHQFACKPLLTYKHTYIHTIEETFEGENFHE